MKLIKFGKNDKTFQGRGALKGSYLYGSSSGGEKDDSSSTLNADNFEPIAKKRSRMDRVDEEGNSDVWRFIFQTF